MSMTLEKAIAKQNDLASYWKMEMSEQYAAEHRQLADINRAKMILDVFGDSLGRME